MFTPYERDKLLLAVAADIARKRLDRGLQLNWAEANALLAWQIIEWARDGATVAELMDRGRRILHQVGELNAGFIIGDDPATLPNGEILAKGHDARSA